MDQIELDSDDSPTNNGAISPRATKLLLQHLFGPIPQTPKDSLFRPWYVVASRIQPGFDPFLSKPKGSISAKLVFDHCNSPSRLNKNKVLKKVQAELECEQKDPHRIDYLNFQPAKETLCSCCFRCHARERRYVDGSKQSEKPYHKDQCEKHFTLPRRNYSTSNHPLRHVYSANDVEFAYEQSSQSVQELQAIRGILESPFSSIGDGTPFTSFKIFSTTRKISNLQSKNHHFLRKVTVGHKRIRRRILTAFKGLSQKMHTRRNIET